MNKILGIDMGIASLGYAVVNIDDENFVNGDILASGVRIFDVAESPDGSSLAAPRRAARSVRRILRRKVMRIKAIKQLFLDFNLLSPQELDLLSKQDFKTLYQATREGQPIPSVWEIRARALDNPCSMVDICRALLHIAKRRGFRSMRKSEKLTGEAGKLLKGVEEMQKKLQESHFRTIGELLFHLPATEPKRNKDGSYSHSVARSLLEEEVHLILQAQRAKGANALSQEFETQFCKIAFLQNPLQPSDPGFCTLEPTEPRAPKNAYTAELFAALCKINHIYLEENGQSHALSAAQRALALEKCFSTQKTNYKQLRELFNLPNDIKFNISYTAPAKKKSKKKEETKSPEQAVQAPQEYDAEKNTTLYNMAGFHALKKALKSSPLWAEYQNNPNGILDKIAEVLSRYKSDGEIRQYLTALGLPAEAVEKLQNVNFSGFMNLSLVAMNKIIPFLKEGCRYDVACKKAGYNFQAPQQNKGLSKLPPLTQEDNHTITSPVAKRSLAQARKVINALNKKYGPFDAVHIEVAREIGKSFEKRKEIEAKQKANAAELAQLKEVGIDGIIPQTETDLKKLRLWKEQDGRCMYSLQYIEPKKILEEGYCQVDHIIPYSLSFDNSLNNQVLCLTSENQHKKNQIPYEYFHSGKAQITWEKFEGYVVNSLQNMRMAKKHRLLKQELTEDDLQGFKERNLSDTKLISRFMKNYLLANLRLTGKYKQGVFCVNGKHTSTLRGFWRLQKIREDGDKHHALDAIVIACCTNRLMQYISTKYRQNREIELQRKEVAVPWPFPHFKHAVENSLLSIFVSRPPRKKVTGALHKNTFFSAKHIKKGIKTLRTDIQKLTLDSLKKQRELEVKYFGVERNKPLYDLIETALNNRPNDKTPIQVQMPTKNGGFVPVRHIKLISESTSGIPVLGGTALAENDSMPRVDVFLEDGQYYVVPVYTMDFAKGVLPLVAQPSGRLMKKENFVFSLYKDDYVNLVNKQGETWEGYFKQLNAQTGQIYLESHDRSAQYTVSGKPSNQKKIASSTLKLIEKYQIDIFGGKHLVKKEKYIGIIRKNKGFGG